MSENISLKDLSAFMPRMPTPEEHRSASLKWLERVRPTLIDQWPDDLAALSVPTKLLKLDVEAVWSNMCDLHDGKSIGDDLKDLARSLDEMIGWKRSFIRLNSRSPKDNAFPFEVPATISGKEAVSMLMGSMRVMDDLMEFRWVPEQPAFVAVRDFDPRINGANEFRCFAKNGGLIAVTHYDYLKPTPEWVRTALKEIRDAIDGYFVSRLKPVLHVDTVVFDVAMFPDSSFVMIEINPYGLSDPCHFGSYANVEAASSFVEIGGAA